MGIWMIVFSHISKVVMKYGMPEILAVKMLLMNLPN